MARGGAPQQIGLQTTVMVDVLFILLIFFIVVSRIRDTNLQVDLPSVQKQKKHPTQRQQRGTAGLVLSIDKQGGLHLDGRELGGLSGLRKTLRGQSARTAPGQTPVVLRTDKQAPSGVTVQVVHLLAELGFAKIQFDVLTAQPPENKQ